MPGCIAARACQCAASSGPNRDVRDRAPFSIPRLERAPVPARKRRREAGSACPSSARRSRTAKISKVKASHCPRISWIRYETGLARKDPEKKALRPLWSNLQARQGMHPAKEPGIGFEPTPREGKLRFPLMRAASAMGVFRKELDFPRRSHVEVKKFKLRPVDQLERGGTTGHPPQVPRDRDPAEPRREEGPAGTDSSAKVETIVSTRRSAGATITKPPRSDHGACVRTGRTTMPEAARCETRSRGSPLSRTHPLGSIPARRIRRAARKERRSAGSVRPIIRTGEPRFISPEEPAAVPERRRRPEPDRDGSSTREPPLPRGR